MKRAIGYPRSENFYLTVECCGEPNLLIKSEDWKANRLRQTKRRLK